jgi:hypothetical protein
LGPPLPFLPPSHGKGAFIFLRRSNAAAVAYPDWRFFSKQLAMFMLYAMYVIYVIKVIFDRIKSILFNELLSCVYLGQVQPLGLPEMPDLV